MGPEQHCLELYFPPQIIESQLKIKQEQVGELQAQASHLQELEPEKEPVITEKKVRIEERFAKMLEPLEQRRNQLEKAKRVHQFMRDVEDERIWIEEKMPQATSTDYGNSLMSVQMLQKKNKSLRQEIDGHEPHIQSVLQVGRELIDEEHPQSQEFEGYIDELTQKWEELLRCVEERRRRLELSQVAQQVWGC